MKKNLSFDQMQNSTGGSVVGSFCVGFGAVAAVYRLGTLAMWWNPVGQTLLWTGAIIGVGCVAYAALS